MATLEDGSYLHEINALNPQFQQKVSRFVRALISGWAYAVDHRDEAVDIAMWMA